MQHIIKQNVSFHPMHTLLEDGLLGLVDIFHRVGDNSHTCVMQVQIDCECLTGPKHISVENIHGPDCMLEA